MDSAGFNVAVKNFTNLTSEEAMEVKSLSQQYPYSQLLHLLVARVSKDQNDKYSEQLLHQSAVYSTDRSVLKWVMTTPQHERIEEIAPVIVNVRESKPVIEERITSSAPGVVEVKAFKLSIDPIKAASQKDVPLTGDALRNDIYQELEKLKRLKHDFELSYDEFQKATEGNNTALVSKVVKETATDPLIEEIKSSKKKLKVDNPKQKEQNEIIDQFIKTQPVIAKPKSAAPADDLSEDSSVFSDNIVSETLVDILLKQGKKEKAIEVLKKLIWKFPQKKAYFAAQIEELKN